jgi:hypothetical protein
MKLVAAVFAAALVAAGGASAEVVARGVADGMVAVSPRGGSAVAYARGRVLFVARRTDAGNWRPDRVARLGTGSTLAAFAVGPAGPVVLVTGPGERTLTLYRRGQRGWRATPIVARLGRGVVLGAPGLAIDRAGRPAVAYTRWRQRKHLSQLVLVRVRPRGLRAQNVTTNGWPASYVAPPAAPVVMPDGSIHVVETYGFLGTVGTIEWYPTGKTWTGQYLSGDQGDWPVGAMFADVGGSGVVYAAWTEGTIAWDEYPVNLASHGRQIASDFVFDRALTTGLALTAGGPHVAANQWVSSAQLGLAGSGFVWAGTISGAGGTELDGWLSGLAAAPRGAEDVLVSSGSTLSWFRAHGFPVRVTLGATRQPDGSVALFGRVRGRTSGTVTIYRERPGGRTVAGTPALNGGTFSFVDSAPAQPALYRAVYVDPATGIPYARLLREPVG